MKKNIRNIIINLILTFLLIRISNGAESNFYPHEEIKKLSFRRTLLEATRDLLDFKIPRLDFYTAPVLRQQDLITMNITQLLEQFVKDATKSLVKITHEYMQYDNIPQFPDVFTYELSIHKTMSDAMYQNFDLYILPNIQLPLTRKQRQEMIDCYINSVEAALIHSWCVTRSKLINEGFFREMTSNM